MTNNFYIKLGKKIFELRKAQNVSREKFAEIAGMNDYYLGEIERGEKHASIDVLLKICNVLNIKLAQLVDIE